MGSVNFPHELIIRAALEFKGCIECSGDKHLTAITYFHTPECRRGLSLDPELLLKRISERVEYLSSNPPRQLWTVPSGRCSLCSNSATGTHYVKYHRKSSILLQAPVCGDHTEGTESAGREIGYIPGKVFETIFDVEIYLGEV